MNLVPAIPLTVIMVTGIYTVPIYFRVLIGVSHVLSNSRDRLCNGFMPCWGRTKLTRIIHEPDDIPYLLLFPG